MTLPRFVRTRSSFDPLVDRLETARLALAEPGLLRASHWELGQDARLREDARFRRTPWGLWMRAEDILANDALYRELHAERRGSADLQAMLRTFDTLFGRRCVFCPGDPRFVLDGDEVRLAASELSKEPVLEEEIGELEKYTTHLPLLTLQAAAASEPLGQWGNRAQEDVVEPLGWMALRLPRGINLNDKMFVARLQGHSMDSGSNRLRDGALVVFQFDDSDPYPNTPSALVAGPSVADIGSYAVKQVAIERDGDGHTSSVKLLSLNPDEERYPDIAVASDGEFRLIARVIRPLSASDYARRPRPLRRKGRRDLSSEDALRKLHRDLSDRATRFFGAECRTPVDEDGEVDSAVWNSQLVCLDAAAGGLHVQVGPLLGLWRFVKVLVARAASGETWRTLASNARLRPIRVPVRPSDEAWTWAADGFEDDPDVDLSALDLDGLPSDRASAFHVGADGVGRRLLGEHISPGQAYRLLVPPDVWVRADCSIQASVLADEWRLVEIALLAEPDPGQAQPLERLGFTLGKLTPALSFGLASWPDEWRTTPRGDGFAAFVAGRGGAASLLLTAEGYQAEVDGEAQLLVHGPGGGQRVSLPAGSCATVELSNLEIGEYFCSLLHERTRVQRAHLAFEVSAQLEAPPPARAAMMTLQTGAEQAHTAQALPNRRMVAWRGDLSLPPSEESALKELALEGPPGWGVRVLWREVASHYLSTLELDSDGQLDAARLLRLTSERRERRPVGDLILDLGDLGSLVLEHDKPAMPERMREQLREQVTAKAKRVRQRRGTYLELLPLWFEPVSRSLGYEVEAVTAYSQDPEPSQLALARLLIMERRPTEITKRCTRILVMQEEMEPAVDEALFAWIDRQCQQQEVERAVLTDGLGWAEHQRRSRLPLKIWQLETVLDDSEAFIEFLRDVAVV